MKDEIITLDTAKLAKEKGFNWLCTHHYKGDKMNGTYKRLIAAGFTREDLDDPIIYNATGRHPFRLTFAFNKDVMIYVDSEDLYTPKLVVYKGGENDKAHWIKLTVDQALDLISGLQK